MILMEEKEFVLETLKRIIPDTSWHGETTHDYTSVENIPVVEEMIYMLVEKFMYGANCAREGNYSAERISKEKGKVIEGFVEAMMDDSLWIKKIFEYIKDNANYLPKQYHEYLNKDLFEEEI